MTEEKVFCCMNCDKYHDRDTYYCIDCDYENGEIVNVNMPGGIGVGKVVNNPPYYRNELRYEIHGKIKGQPFVTIAQPHGMSRVDT